MPVCVLYVLIYMRMHMHVRMGYIQGIHACQSYLAL